MPDDVRMEGKGGEGGGKDVACSAGQHRDYCTATRFNFNGWRRRRRRRS